MLVKVWNDNTHPFTQEFKGNKIHIEAGKYFEMEFGEASDFIGAYAPVTLNADGQKDPKSFKRLRIDEKDVVKAKTGVVAEHKCQACGKICSSADELLKHINEHHLSQLVDEDVAKEVAKEVEKKGSKK